MNQKRTDYSQESDEQIAADRNARLLDSTLLLTEAGAEEIGRKAVSTLLPEVRDSLARRAPVMSGGIS